MVETNYGKAYAFFYCEAPKREIEETLPTIRECVQTPSELELQLLEIAKELQIYPSEPKLTQIIEEAKNSGMRYFLEAKYLGATNEKTADELSAILNQAYQSPLYQEEEPFRGAIAYEDKGEYIFRE